MLTAKCSEELPNPYKSCVRDMLDCLACHDNEYQRKNIELKNLEAELKQKVDSVIFQGSEYRKLKCASQERIDEFHSNIKNIDNITESYKKRIDEIQLKRQEILNEAKKCFDNLCSAKLKLRNFNEESIEHLKSVAVQSNDREIIKNCEKDINELSRLFLREVSYIKKCESIMKPFMQLLHTCRSPLNCECDCLDNYDWIPEGKSFEVIQPIVSDIKDLMGSTLRKAFAQLHIHKPKDPNSFLASYLMTLDHNEEMMQKKLKLIEFHK